MAKRKKNKRNSSAPDEENLLYGSDETFAFIAGYTAGGFPYGITWEEAEELAKRDAQTAKEIGLPDPAEEDPDDCDLPF